jgi:hypothetical protein
VNNTHQTDQAGRESKSCLAVNGGPELVPRRSKIVWDFHRDDAAVVFCEISNTHPIELHMTGDPT